MHLIGILAFFLGTFQISRQNWCLRPSRDNDDHHTIIVLKAVSAQAVQCEPLGRHKETAPAPCGREWKLERMCSCGWAALGSRSRMLVGDRWKFLIEVRIPHWGGGGNFHLSPHWELSRSPSSTIKQVKFVYGWVCEYVVVVGVIAVLVTRTDGGHDQLGW